VPAGGRRSMPISKTSVAAHIAYLGPLTKIADFLKAGVEVCLTSSRSNGSRVTTGSTGYDFISRQVPPPQILLVGREV